MVADVRNNLIAANQNVFRGKEYLRIQLPYCNDEDLKVRSTLLTFDLCACSFRYHPERGRLNTIFSPHSNILQTNLRFVVSKAGFYFREDPTLEQTAFTNRHLTCMHLETKQRGIP